MAKFREVGKMAKKPAKKKAPKKKAPKRKAPKKKAPKKKAPTMAEARARQKLRRLLGHSAP